MRVSGSLAIAAFGSGGSVGPGLPQYGQKRSPSGTCLPHPGHSLVGAETAWAVAASKGAGEPAPSSGLPQ